MKICRYSLNEIERKKNAIFGHQRFYQGFEPRADSVVFFYFFDSQMRI